MARSGEKRIDPESDRVGASTRSDGSGFSRIASSAMRGFIRAYQLLVSPVLGPRCRYLPSCSDYAMEALHAHGPWRGGWYALRRISRCHPWAGSGYDPVPMVKNVRR